MKFVLQAIFGGKNMTYFRHSSQCISPNIRSGFYDTETCKSKQLILKSRLINAYWLKRKQKTWNLFLVQKSWKKTKKNSAYYVIVEQIDEKVVSNDNITDDNCHW